MKRLDGKIVIITGSTLGLGKAAALRFAGEGAKVVTCDRGGTLEDRDVARLGRQSDCRSRRDGARPHAMRDPQRTVGAICPAESRNYELEQRRVFGEEIRRGATEWTDFAWFGQRQIPPR